MRSGRALVALSCGLVLVAGCSGAGEPTASSAVTSGGGPTGDVALDSGSKLVVDPVGPDGKGLVSATFSEPREGRTVYLQTQADGGWTTLATGSENAKGTASFAAPSGTNSYRAVAVGEGSDAVATAVQAKDKQYHSVLTAEFDGNQLDEKYWAPRQTDFYGPSRRCSSPTPSMYKVGDGTISLSVDQSSAARAKVAKAAAIKLGADKANPCPYGAFDNAMVATETLFQFKYGVVATRVKFSPDQGLHGAVWLQTPGGGDEIDFIESFGLGKGIQYKLHSTAADGTVVSTGGYIKSIPEVKNADWWDEFHVASIEWTPTEYVFSVDGQVVQRTEEGVSQTDKFVIMSQLTSDWELPRLDPEKLPSTMEVDWIRVWQQ